MKKIMAFVSICLTLVLHSMQQPKITLITSDNKKIEVNRHSLTYFATFQNILQDCTTTDPITLNSIDSHTCSLLLEIVTTCLSQPILRKASLAYGEPPLLNQKTSHSSRPASFPNLKKAASVNDLRDEQEKKLDEFLQNYKPKTWISILEAASFLNNEEIQQGCIKKIASFLLISSAQLNDFNYNPLIYLQLLTQLDRLPAELHLLLKKQMNFDALVKTFYSKPFRYFPRTIATRSPRTILINSVLSSSGRNVATASKKNNKTKIDITNIAQQKLLHQLRLKSESSCIGFSHDKRILVTQTDKKICLWDLIATKLLKKFPLTNIMVFSANDRFFAAYNKTKSIPIISLYNTITGKTSIIKNLPFFTHYAANITLNFSPNEHYLTACYSDQQAAHLDIWHCDTQTFFYGTSLAKNSTHSNKKYDFSAQGNFLAYINQNNKALVMPIHSQGMHIEFPFKYRSLLFCPHTNNRILLAPNASPSSLYYADAFSGALHKDKKISVTGPITSFALSNDERWLAISFYNQATQNHEIALHKKHHYYQNYCLSNQASGQLQFSSNSTHLLFQTDSTKTPYIWHLPPPNHLLQKALDECFPSHVILLALLKTYLKKDENFELANYPKYLQTMANSLPEFFASFFPENTLSL